MHNLSTLFIFSPKNLRAKLSKGCLRGFVNTNIDKKCLSNIVNYFFKKEKFEKYHLNTSEGESTHFAGSDAREN